MDIFLDEFAALRDMIRDGRVDELREKMRLSTKRRAYFNKK